MAYIPIELKKQNKRGIIMAKPDLISNLITINKEQKKRRSPMSGQYKAIEDTLENVLKELSESATMLAALTSRIGELEKSLNISNIGVSKRVSNSFEKYKRNHNPTESTEVLPNSEAAPVADPLPFTFPPPKEYPTHQTYDDNLQTYADTQIQKQSALKYYEWTTRQGRKV